MISDDCIPYSEQACIDAGSRLGLQLGGGGTDFIGDWETKGCYGYENGEYAGLIFYGMGGSDEDMKATPTSPKYRPSGHDCYLGNIGNRCWTENVNH